MPRVVITTRADDTRLGQLAIPCGYLARLRSARRAPAGAQHGSSTIARVARAWRAQTRPHLGAAMASHLKPERAMKHNVLSIPPRFAASFAASFAALAFAACVAAPEAGDPSDASDEGAPVAASNPAGIVRTRVYLQPDGQAPVVRTDHITQAQHAAELAARDDLQRAPADHAHPRIAVDNGCAASSLWIFDGLDNHVGTFPFNHELCVFQQNVNGCLDLRALRRYCILNPNGTVSSCPTWGTNGQSAIGSFWSGETEGYFTGLENPFFVMTPFGLYDRQDNASVVNTHPNTDASGVAFAQYVCFGPPA
jgi:hypothetical protein